MTKLGALWVRTSKAGNKFMSGQIEIEGQKTDLIIFKNKNKKTEKHPDLIIYLSEPREPRPVVDDFEDEIPF